MRLVATALPFLLLASGCEYLSKDVPPSPPWPGAPLVIVSIDTLRADHLGAYGYDRPTSPRLDEFARASVLFRRAVAPSPTTLPSHTSLFTGLFPSSNGVRASKGFRAPDRLLTLAEFLRERGYATASFNDGAYMSARFGLGQGFAHRHEVKLSVQDTATRSTHLRERVNRALAWLDQTKPKRFFLFVHSYEVHIPLSPPAGHLTVLEDSYEGSLGNVISTKQWFRLTGSTTDPKDVQHWINLYDASIRSADAGFETLIAGLRERGLYEDTMIVVVSDHGEELGERGRMSMHGPRLFDEVLLVPLIVKYPAGAFAGRVVDQQVRLVDVFPTVVESLGFDVPAGIEGQTLTSLIIGEAPEDRASVSVTLKQAAFRTPRWKLYKDGENLRLFDLRADPGETTDVAEAQPKTLAALQARMRSFARNPARAEAATERARRPEKIDETTRQRLRALGYLE